MSIALLDVNVLIAVLWPDHIDKAKARTWFSLNRASGWATCVITQAGFARITAQPPRSYRVEEALGMLNSFCAEPDHYFWPLDSELTGLHTEIRQRLRGHGQLTDAILLDLAIRRGGRLVTLDQGIRHLLPAASPHQAAIEVIGSK